jgi:hypothetical protein
MRQMVHEMLARAAARGELRPDLDLEAASRLVHALTIAISDPQLLPYLNDYFQVVGDSAPPETVFEALLDLLERGLGAP